MEPTKYNEIQCYNALRTIASYGQVGMASDALLDDCEPLAAEGSSTSGSKDIDDPYWTDLGERINAACVKHSYPPIMAVMSAENVMSKGEAILNALLDHTDAATEADKSDAAAA